MDPLTIFLAKLIGPTVVALSIGIFFSRKYYEKVYRDLDKETLAVVMGGVTILVAGLAMVIFHNIWDSFFSGLISLTGWLAILKGLMLIICPATVNKIGDKIVGTKVLPSAAVIYFFVGLYISYVAYLA
jgi:uncharacterized membrane protein